MVGRETSPCNRVTCSHPLIMAIMNKRKYSQAFGKAARYGYQAYKTYKRYKPVYDSLMKNKGSSRSGVTQQRDVQVQYRKKRMPARKRRTWTKFVKKVQAANERALGTKTLVYNYSYTGSSTTANGQNFLFCSLYGCHGSAPANEIGSNDLYTLFENAYDVTGDNNKLTFKSAVLDVTLTNTGTNKLEVDVYVLSYWGQSAFANFNAAHSEAAADTPTMDPNSTGFFTPLTIFKRGVTLFDMPALIKNAKCTVVKKIKYWIDVGDTVTYQIRDPRTHVISENQVVDNFHPTLPKLTQSLFINFKPVSGSSDTSGNTLTMGVTRKYSINSADVTDQDGWTNF